MKNRHYTFRYELQEKSCAFPGCPKTFKTRNPKRIYHDPLEGKTIWNRRRFEEYKQLKEKDRINSAIMDALLKEKGVIS